MIEMDIDIQSVLDFTKQEKKTKEAIADSLNIVGEKIRSELVNHIAIMTGTEPAKVSPYVTFEKATTKNLQIGFQAPTVLYEQDGSLVPPRVPKTVGEWKKRKFEMMPGVLVWILTARDDRVCPICVKLGEEGPYTAEEANKLLNEGAGAHPNCRCSIVPFYPAKSNRIEASFMTGRGMTRPRTLGMNQIAARLISEQSHQMMRRLAGKAA